MAACANCAVALISALLLPTPAHGETNLTCKGEGTITNHSRGAGADQSVAVDVDFTVKFDETTGTLSARVPNVDYLRRLKLTNGWAAAERVSFSEQEITAQFHNKNNNALWGVMTMGVSALTWKIPPLVIDRFTGRFTWGPHSGLCSPVTAEETQRF